MIHQLTAVDPRAKIGQNVTVDPFTTIAADVEIGEGTWIGSNVTIMNGARIGKNCRIFPGTVIAAIPQDLKFDGEESQVIIGDNTTIRECVTVNRGTKALGYTKIGNNCLIMATSHIAHDCVVGDNAIIVNGCAIGGHVEIGDYAIIGGLSAVHQFSRIGKHVITAGGSLVRKDIPPYVIADGQPARVIGLNSVGLSRAGISEEVRRSLKQAFRIIYRSGFSLSRAIEEMEMQLDSSVEIENLLRFLRNADRGIMRTRRD